MKDQIYDMVKKAAAKQRRKILIAEGWDERCLEAVSIVQKEDILDLILLDNGEVKKNAEKFDIDFSKLTLIDYKKYDLDEMADAMVELRKHKGLTKQAAEKLLADENYFACMYVHIGKADALVGSKICPTASLMRPTLQLLREKGKLVSEVALLYEPKNDRLYFASDASLNIDPSAEDLSQMAINAAGIAKEVGVEPKVAMLSFSTKGSGGNNEKTLKVREAVKLAKEKDPNMVIDGEIQFDAAINPYAASRKCPDSPLKGESNVLIFPDLNASNIFVHAMFQITDMEAIFTLTAGLRHPVGILGRSTPTEYVVNILYAMAMECNSQ